MRQPAPIVACILAALLASACQDPLPRKSLLVGLRLLNVVTDPPDAKPGELVTLTPVAVDEEGRTISYEWAVCVVPAFADDDDEEYDTEDCLQRLENGEPGVTHLGTDATAQYLVPADFFEDPSVVADAYGFGDELPAELLPVLAAVIGVNVTISLRVSAGSDTIRALKRLKVSLSPTPNQNPAPVAWVLRKAPSEAVRDAEGFLPEPFPEFEAPEEGRCLAAVGGNAPSVNSTDGWELVPVNLPTTFESYPVVGVSADPAEPFQVVDVDEVYVFQFFSTLGSLEIESDSFVDPNETEPPDEHPGTGSWSFDTFPEGMVTVPLWIVTRDGRGGSVWCFDEIRIDRSSP